MTKIRTCLEIYNLNEKLDEYIETWKDHVERMDEAIITKKILKYNTKGRRKNERLKGWADEWDTIDLKV